MSRARGVLDLPGADASLIESGDHAYRLALREQDGLDADELRVAMVRKIVSTQEAERKRIAREIHDNIGQQMTALKLKLNNIAARANTVTESVEQITELQALANRIEYRE